MYFTFNGEDTPCRLRTKRYCIRTFLLLAAERQGAMRHLRFVNSPIIRLSLRKKQISNEAAVWRPVSMPLMLTLWMEENRKIMWSTQKKMRTAL